MFVLDLFLKLLAQLDCGDIGFFVGEDLGIEPGYWESTEMPWQCPDPIPMWSQVESRLDQLHGDAARRFGPGLAMSRTTAVLARTAQQFESDFPPRTN